VSLILNVMKLILKSFNVVLTALLAVLGFSSCINDEDELDMYGAPFADYIIIGNVSSAETGKPIKDIHVTLHSEYYENADESTTDVDGNYKLIDKGDSPNDTVTLQVAFSDTDGDENGAFNDTTVTVKIPQSKLSGGKGWYSGEATETVDMKLQPKK
jgi:putative lipoprotein (rSAM/lipoprotein system)